jgi:hypothetical protein
VMPFMLRCTSMYSGMLAPFLSALGRTAPFVPQAAS